MKCIIKLNIKSAPVFHVVWVVLPFLFGVLLVFEDEKMSCKLCRII